MSRLVICGMSVILVLCVVGTVLGDADADCQALAEECTAIFKQMGKENALSVIDDRSGPFVRGDLYAFAVSMDNVMLAHPHDKTIKRVNMSNVQDVDGKRFFEKCRELATNPGAGWVEYTWAKPGQEQATRKKTYIMKVPGEDIYIGVGHYFK